MKDSVVKSGCLRDKPTLDVGDIVHGNANPYHGIQIMISLWRLQIA